MEGSASAGASTTTTTTSAPATSTTTASQAQSNTTKVASQTPSTASKEQSQNATQGQSQNNQSQTSPSAASDDFEEIALGSTKGKVPKAIAKAIKDYERGIQAKFQESAKQAKAAQEKEQILALFKSNPDEFAKRMGVDLDTMAEERLAKKYEVMQMSPEQRENMQLKQQMEQMRQQELGSKKGVIDEIKGLLGAEAPEGLEQYPKEELQAFLAHKQGEYNQLQSGIEKEFVDAWKETGLPRHKFFGAQMAFQMLNHQKRTGESLQAGEAAAKVKGDFLGAVKEIVSQMDPSGIQELLGKDVLEKIRQADIERVTGQAASSMQKSPAVPAASEQPKKQLNQFEWRKAMGLS